MINQSQTLLLPASLFASHADTQTISQAFQSFDALTIWEDHDIIRAFSSRTFSVIVLPAPCLPYIPSSYILAQEGHLFSKDGWLRLVPLPGYEHTSPRFVTLRTRWSTGYSLLAFFYPHFFPIFRTRELILEHRHPSSSTHILIDWFDPSHPFESMGETLDEKWYKTHGYEVPLYLTALSQALNEQKVITRSVYEGLKHLQKTLEWPDLHVVSFYEETEFSNHLAIFFEILQCEGILPTSFSVNQEAHKSM